MDATAVIRGTRVPVHVSNRMPPGMRGHPESQPASVESSEPSPQGIHSVYVESSDGGVESSEGPLWQINGLQKLSRGK